MNETVDEIVRYLEVPRMSHLIEVEFQMHDSLQIPLSVWVNLDLKIGMAVSGAQLEELRTESMLARAKDKALQYLKWKPRTERELRTYLRGKEFSDSVSERVIEALRETGLVDDAAYANLYVQQKRTSLSRRELSWKLEQRGIPSNLVYDALNAYYSKDDEWAIAQGTAQKFDRKQRNLPMQKRRQRLGAHLERHGFPTGIIRQLVFGLTDENVDEGSFLDND